MEIKSGKRRSNLVATACGPKIPDDYEAIGNASIAFMNENTCQHPPFFFLKKKSALENNLGCLAPLGVVFRELFLQQQLCFSKEERDWAGKDSILQAGIAFFLKQHLPWFRWPRESCRWNKWKTLGIRQFCFWAT